MIHGKLDIGNIKLLIFATLVVVAIGGGTIVDVASNIGEVPRKSQEFFLQVKKNIVTARNSFAPTSSAVVKNKNMRAALSTIAWAEGTYRQPNSGYNTLIGGRQISNVSRHPNICIPFGRRGQCSTAFGRYQALNRTWWGNMGLKPMTPENQDKFAIKLLRSCGVVDDILEGNSAWIVNECVGKTWASFPSNSYGQPQKSQKSLIKTWQKFKQ